MIVWGAATAASLIATTALAVYIVARVPRTPTRLPFALLMIAFAMWDLGEAVVRLAPAASPEALLPWIRLQWVGIALTSGTFLHFGLNFATGRPLRTRPWLLAVTYGVSAVVASLVLATGWIVEGVADGSLGPVADVGPAYPAAAVWYETWFIATIATLIRAYLRNRSPEVRRRSRGVVLVLAVAAVLASATEVFWPLYTPSPGNLGLSSIYMLAVAVGASVSEIRFHFLEIPALTERTRGPAPSTLRPGLATLFLSRTRDPAFEAFRDAVSAIPGLCLTGVHPAKLQERYGLERTPILWFTSATEGERAVRPRALEFEVLHSVARFMKDNPATVVLVDDVDLLVHTVGFDAVARFLHRVNNLATGRGSTALAAADPDALTEAQLALLRGLFDEVRESPPPVSFLEPVLPPGPGSVLLEGDPEAAFSLYESLAGRDRGVLVTTKNPVRLRRRGAAAERVVWIGAGGESGEEGPAAIDLEAGHLATGVLRGVSHPVLYVADLEQLRLHAPFPRVLDFVKGLIDQVAIQGGVLLASVTPKGMSPIEIASLRRRFDRVREL
jgi:hypothetical protein